ncbi:hypothetical protein N0V83_006484 [Neocucurbitaria cava]|uniref:Ubiquitin-like protease family profile domain-containing protein n=1 Tax=Neocucurbitaria cava TaxID=798079 RepID=A0A9W9CKT6_9PLEO|nr:hypothetical protein N0V83_006484 [Neocucurbitaria cava]
MSPPATSKPRTPVQERQPVLLAPQPQVPGSDEAFELGPSATQPGGIDESYVGGGPASDPIGACETSSYEQPMATSGLQGQSGGQSDNQTGLGMLELAETTRLAENERSSVTRAVLAAAPTDSLALHLQPLVKKILDKSNESGKPERNTSLSLYRTGKQVFLDDVLSLYYLDNEEMAAWFTSTIVTALLDIEARHAHHDTLVDRDFGLYMEREYLMERLDKDIELAETGNVPEYSWPLGDLNNAHSRVLACVNPTSNHWVTVEIVLQDPPRIRYFNSMPNASPRAPKDLSKVLYLASLNPESPLPKFNAEEVAVELVDCPQQASCGVDCGPFSIFFLAQRIHDRSVSAYGMSVQDHDRHHFGQYLRYWCAYAVWNYHIDAAYDTPLSDLFDGYEPPASVASSRPNPSPPGTRQPRQGPVVAASNTNGADDLSVDTRGTGNDEPFKATEMLRLVLDEQSDHVKTIVIIVRWSSRPLWLDQMTLLGKSSRSAVIQRIRNIAQARFVRYIESTGDTRTEADVVILAAMRVQTIYFPCGIRVSKANQNEGSIRDSHTNEDEENQTVEVTMRCPCCIHKVTMIKDDNKGTITRRYDTIKRHVGIHMNTEFPVATRQETNGLWHADCPWPNCDWDASKETERMVKKMFKEHLGGKHAEEWLENNTKDIAASCNCGLSGCRQTYQLPRQWSDFQKHTKSISGAFLSRKVQCAWDVYTSDITTKTWSEFLEVLRDRLLRTTDLKCSWALANQEDCDRTAFASFASEAELLQHYDADHSGHIWPLPVGKETRCLKKMSPYQLARHETYCHVLRVVSETRPGRIDNVQGQRQAYGFTNLVTAELRKAASGQTEALQPVLLSVGIDGFTCNTALMREWLQVEEDLNFTFAMTTEALVTLDPRHLQGGVDCYTGLYNAQEMREALIDRGQASSKFLDLFRVWDAQQQAKDAQSEYLVIRNRRVPHEDEENEVWE